MIAALTFALWLAMAAGTADVTVATVLRGDVALPLAPAGRSEFKREDTVTRVRIELDRVAPPSALGAVYNSYVVWAVSPEGSFENIGEVQLEKDKGRFDATTRFEQAGVLITAEPHYMVDRPSSAVAFRSQNPKREIRSVSVAVAVGTYDYFSVQATPAPGAPSLVLQARAALQIARNAQAERLAEAEFRRAKVALDTMEEIVSRASPLDIVMEAANEVIRRGQQAVTAAREREPVLQLQNARTDASALRQEIQTLNSRNQQLTSERDAGSAQIQKLQSDLAAATRDAQRVTQERDQALARASSATRELSDLQKRRDELRSQLVVPLREDFFDIKTQGLTVAGREALARVRGLADAVPGEVELQGPAADAVFEAARQYLLQSGLAPERIVVKR
jgi:hypothetical protein